MYKKIAITGPESTGKTMLSEALAVHYKTACVPEYARSYMATLNRHYEPRDLEIIAKRQLKLLSKYENQNDNILISDTELIVIKIWFEHAFKMCPKWILNKLNQQNFSLYLLCDIDLPWIPDPQREHPHLREYFFNLYKAELDTRQWPYAIISGKEFRRVDNAIKVIDKILQ